MEKAGEVRFEANVCSLAAPVQTQPTKVPVAAEGTKAPAAKKAAPKKPAKKAAESAREAKEDPVKAETANAEKKPCLLYTSIIETAKTERRASRGKCLKRRETSATICFIRS